MVESSFDSAGTQGQIILYPNRSASWQSIKQFLWVISAFAFTIAFSFAFVGLWMVLPFAGLEIFALVGLMYWVALQCRRQEVIRIADHRIIVEQGYEAPKKTWQSDLFLTRLVVYRPPGFGRPERLYLRGKKQQLEIGVFLNEEDKKRLVAELRGVVGVVNW